MRSLHILGLAAFVAMTGSAFAQGAGKEPAPAADQAQQMAVDTAYVGRCEAKTTKEICGCVVAVADSQFGDPTERGIFYDFMMGEVEKAKGARASLDPQQNMKFNIALQKADLLLGERCDKLKPKAPEEQKQPAQKMP